jgi:hypothetical protein
VSADTPVPATAGSASEPAPPPPFRRRFVIAFGVLVALVLAAGITALVLGLSGGSSGGAPWSTWKPTDNGLGGAQQIADRVAATYKLQDGHQLVSVKASDLKFPQLIPVNGQPSVVDAPFSLVQVGRNGNSDKVQFLDGKGVLLTMCGLGAQCSVKTAASSPQQMLVVRREALELSLYTLKYIDGVKSVVVLTPPSKTGAQTGVMLFRRDTTGGLLSRPLARTLPNSPPRPNHLKRRDVGQLRALTQSHVFTYQVQSAPDGSALMVLTQAG